MEQEEEESGVNLSMTVVGWLLPSLDTMDTMTEVQVEELWTRTVKSTPIMRPTTGLLSISFPWNTLPEM